MDLPFYASAFRTVWFCGRYGGGKTSGALWLADKLIRAGEARLIATNFELFKGRELHRYDNFDAMMADESFSDCVMIYDESHMHLGRFAKEERINAYTAYLRKRNLILLLPSVRKLHSEFRDFRIYRYWNGLVFGLPVWLYRYRVDIGMKDADEGRLVLWFPQRVFSWYDTKARPSMEWRVYEWLETSPSDNDSSADNGGGGTVLRVPPSVP